MDTFHRCSDLHSMASTGFLSLIVALVGFDFGGADRSATVEALHIHSRVEYETLLQRILHAFHPQHP